MDYAIKGPKARPISDEDKEKYINDGWEIESDYANSEHFAKSNPSADEIVEDDE